jgi:hypothetical protein
MAEHNAPVAGVFFHTDTDSRLSDVTCDEGNS